MIGRMMIHHQRRHLQTLAPRMTQKHGCRKRPAVLQSGVRLQRLKEDRRIRRQEDFADRFLCCLNLPTTPIRPRQVCFGLRGKAQQTGENRDSILKRTLIPGDEDPCSEEASGSFPFDHRRCGR